MRQDAAKPKVTVSIALISFMSSMSSCLKNKPSPMISASVHMRLDHKFMDMVRFEFFKKVQ